MEHGGNCSFLRAFHRGQRDDHFLLQDVFQHYKVLYQGLPPQHVCHLVLHHPGGYHAGYSESVVRPVHVGQLLQSAQYLGLSLSIVQRPGLMGTIFVLHFQRHFGDLDSGPSHSFRFRTLW